MNGEMIFTKPNHHYYHSHGQHHRDLDVEKTGRVSLWQPAPGQHRQQTLCQAGAAEKVRVLHFVCMQPIQLWPIWWHQI